MDDFLGSVELPLQMLTEKGLSFSFSFSFSSTLSSRETCFLNHALSFMKLKKIIHLLNGIPSEQPVRHV